MPPVYSPFFFNHRDLPALAEVSRFDDNAFYARTSVFDNRMTASLLSGHSIWLVIHSCSYVYSMLNGKAAADATAIPIFSS
jgi:hypothetical protein